MSLANGIGMESYVCVKADINVRYRPAIRVQTDTVNVDEGEKKKLIGRGLEKYLLDV